jgi:hypothetical protein
VNRVALGHLLNDRRAAEASRSLPFRPARFDQLLSFGLALFAAFGAFPLTALSLPIFRAFRPDAFAARRPVAPVAVGGAPPRAGPAQGPPRAGRPRLRPSPGGTPEGDRFDSRFRLRAPRLRAGGGPSGFPVGEAAFEAAVVAVLEGPLIGEREGAAVRPCTGGLRTRLRGPLGASEREAAAAEQEQERGAHARRGPQPPSAGAHGLTVPR